MIKRSADPAIASAWQEFSSADRAKQLTKFARRANELPPDVKEIQVVFLDGVGAVIEVLATDPTVVDIANQYGITNGTLIYETDDFKYYHTPVCDECDGYRGDPKLEIFTLSAKHVREMELMVVNTKYKLIEMNKALAHIDCIMALAQCAFENQLERPLITNENELLIKDGRNLLEEKMYVNHILT